MEVIEILDAIEVESVSTTKSGGKKGRPRKVTNIDEVLPKIKQEAYSPED